MSRPVPSGPGPSSWTWGRKRRREERRGRRGWGIENEEENRVVLDFLISSHVFTSRVLEI